MVCVLYTPRGVFVFLFLFLFDFFLAAGAFSSMGFSTSREQDKAMQLRSSYSPHSAVHSHRHTVLQRHRGTGTGIIEFIAFFAYLHLGLLAFFLLAFWLFGTAGDVDVGVFLVCWGV